MTVIPHSRPLLGDGDTAAISAVLKSAILVGGTLPRAFSHSLRGLSSSAGLCSLFASGRSALLAGIKSLQLPPDSGIVVQTYVCDAVIWAIETAGCKPVFTDIDDGWVSSPTEVACVRPGEYAAIILAPPFGILQSARDFRQFGVPIIHDLCQGSPHLLAKTNSADLGDIVTLSFHPTKYMCALSGGAALTMTDKFAEQIKAIEQYNFAHSPFTDVQAAIGLHQLSLLDQFRKRRSAIAACYLNSIPAIYAHRLNRKIDVDYGDLFRLPLDVGSQSFNDLRESFALKGVAVRRGVDQLAHRALDRDEAAFPNAVRAFMQTLSLPFHPSLTDEEVKIVADAAKRLLC